MLLPIRTENIRLKPLKIYTLKASLSVGGWGLNQNANEFGTRQIWV